MRPRLCLPGGAIQTLPWTVRGWHAGTGPSGRSANDTHLSFECCEPAGHTYQGGQMVGYDVAANEAYFRAIYRNAAALTAYLCSQYQLDPLKPGVVICHAEGNALGIASGHADVLHWWPKHGVTMEQFRQDVARLMLGGDLPEDEEENDMTQEKFDEMMDRYLIQRAQWPQAPGRNRPGSGPRRPAWWPGTKAESDTAPSPPGRRWSRCCIAWTRTCLERCSHNHRLSRWLE